MNEQINQQILDELQRQTQLVKTSSIITPIIFLNFIVVAILFTPYIASKYRDTPRQTPPSWGDVNSFFDSCNYQEALRIAQKLTKKSPEYWYGYSYIGSIYNALGDHKNAETNFAKAYELFPTKENKENLEAIRSVMNK